MFNLQHPVSFDNRNGHQYLEDTGRLFHPGSDYNEGSGSQDKGNIIKPIAEGKVVFSEWYGKGWGNMVWTEHEFELDEFELEFFKNHPLLKKIPIINNKFTIWFRYGHLMERSVEVGDVVTMDTIIGKVGGSGSTVNEYSPHLHGEAWFSKPNYKGYVVGWSRAKIAESTLPPRILVDISKELQGLNRDQETSEWAKEDVEWCKVNGIMEDDTRPQDSVTREELAVTLRRLHELK